MDNPRTIKDFKIDSVSLISNPINPDWTIEVLNERGSSSMLETHQYIRKPFKIDAVQVAAANIQEIAKWVDGEIRTDDLGQYVKVRVHRPLNDRQTKAYAGDWVLYAGTGYKVYTDKAFKNSFELASGETKMIDTSIVEGEVVENELASKPRRQLPATVEQGEVVGVLEGDVVVPKRVAKKTTAKSA